MQLRKKVSGAFLGDLRPALRPPAEPGDDAVEALDRLVHEEPPPPPLGADETKAATPIKARSSDSASEAGSGAAAAAVGAAAAAGATAAGATAAGASAIACCFGLVGY